MWAIHHWVLLLSTLSLTQGQDVGAGLDPCAQTCVKNVLNSGALGCKAGEASCICQKQDFVFGVRDCARQACPNLEAQATAFVSTFCATATLPTAAPAATSSTSSGDRPTPSSAPQSFVTSAATTEASTTVTETQSTTSSAATSSSSGKSEKSSHAGHDDEDDKDNEDDDQGGLSVGAKAGIGATVALLGLGLLGLAFWLLRRSRTRNSISTGDFHISGPMPGSGRDYAGSHLDFKEGNQSELELRSRRYEDMVPRQQPASMI